MGELKVWSEDESSAAMAWRASNGDSVAHWDVADRLTAMEAEIGYQKSLVAGLRAELAAAKANPDTARLDYMDTNVKLPIDIANHWYEMPGGPAYRDAIDDFAEFRGEATWLS